jgi:hypothetical protein
MPEQNIKAKTVDLDTSGPEVDVSIRRDKRGSSN